LEGLWLIHGCVAASSNVEKYFNVYAYNIVKYCNNFSGI